MEVGQGGREMGREDVAPPTTGLASGSSCLEGGREARREGGEGGKDGGEGGEGGREGGEGRVGIMKNKTTQSTQYLSVFSR